MFSWELKLFRLLGRSHRSLHLVSKLTRETALRIATKSSSAEPVQARLMLVCHSISLYFSPPSGRASQFHSFTFCYLSASSPFVICFVVTELGTISNSHDSDHEEKWRQRREKQEGRNREPRATTILRSRPNFWPSA